MASKSSPSRPKAGTRRPTSDETPSGDTEVPHYHGHRQRLRERFLTGGADALPDYELRVLAVYCDSAARHQAACESADRAFRQVADVIAASPERLMDVDGVKEGTVAALKVVEAAALRLAKGRVLGKPALSSWVRILFLDRKNVLIADEPHQKGTVDHTPVYPREVVKRALELGASGLILVHNHPSGDPTR